MLFRSIYAVLIVTFGVQIARVEGLSMAPTLEDQDRLIVNKLIYRVAEPRRGDIVMLYYPLNPDKSFVKRVIAEEGDTVRRRRKCEACDRRFTTYERIELFFPAVVKKNGSRVDYDRAKVKDSMRLALRKRPVSIEQIDAALERIQEKLLSSGAREIPSTKLGEHVMRELKRIDKVAYVRFASVYRSFRDIAEFQRTVESLVSERGRREGGGS